jgi:1,4-alpha-glucan branching enzyme
MGQEFAHFQEWSVHRQLDWNLFEFQSHDKANHYVRDLFHLYKTERALHELDHQKEGFEWIDSTNSEQSIFSFVRYAKDRNEHVVVILNMTPTVYHNYEIGVPNKGVYEELINSDFVRYGGSDQYNGLLLQTHEGSCHGRENYVKVTIGPLTAVLLKFKG